MFIDVNDDLRTQNIVDQKLNISQLRQFAASVIDTDNPSHKMKTMIGERPADAKAKLSLWSPYGTSYYYDHKSKAKELGERIYSLLLQNNIFTLKVDDYFPDDDFDPSQFFIVAKYIINLRTSFDGKKYIISPYTDFTHPLGLRFPTKELFEETLDKFYSALDIKKAPELEIIK